MVGQSVWRLRPFGFDPASQGIDYTSRISVDNQVVAQDRRARASMHRRVLPVNCHILWTGTPGRAPPGCAPTGCRGTTRRLVLRPGRTRSTFAAFGCVPPSRDLVYPADLVVSGPTARSLTRGFPRSFVGPLPGPDRPAISRSVAMGGSDLHWLPLRRCTAARCGTVPAPCTSGPARIGWRMPNR